MADCQQKIIELASAIGIRINFMGGGVSQQIFIEGEGNAAAHIHITLMTDGSELGYEPTQLSEIINNPFRLPHITVPRLGREGYYYHIQSGNIVVSNTKEIYKKRLGRAVLPSDPEFESLHKLLILIIEKKILETCEFKSFSGQTPGMIASSEEMASQITIDDETKLRNLRTTLMRIKMKINNGNKSSGLKSQEKDLEAQIKQLLQKGGYITKYSYPLLTGGYRLYKYPLLRLYNNPILILSNI